VTGVPQDPTGGSSEARSLGELFSDLTQNMTTLLRQEVALARSELSEKVSQASRSAVSLVVGGVIVHMGVLVLLAALVFVLVQFAGLPLWTAALIVGALVVIAGVIPLLAGLRGLRELELAPKRTIQTLKDDVQAVKETTR
jgi:hypothetical protein